MKGYTVVIHGEPAGGFWAEVPDLPGCYSQGETVEELLENIHEAISGVSEVRRDLFGSAGEPGFEFSV